VSIEAEDVDLGFFEEASLAGDVDGDVGVDDEEALDTDDDGENEELGIDMEESEGVGQTLSDAKR